MTAPDLTNAKWRVSSFSYNNGVCVEVADLDGGHHAVRDSKNRNGPALIFPTAQWSVFTTSVQAGTFR